MKQTILLLLFLCAIVFSCKKNETTPPNVQIETPLNTDSFYIADSIPLRFTIADNNLQSYKIILSNKRNGKIYYKEEGNTNTTDYAIAKKIFAQVQADTLVLLNILGLDKNGNTGRDSVTFKLKY